MFHNLAILRFRCQHYNYYIIIIITILQTAGKRTSDLLEELDNLRLEQNANESNLAFKIAREVERLGESIASRLSNDTPVIAVNYSSLGRYCYVIFF